MALQEPTRFRRQNIYARNRWLRLSVLILYYIHFDIVTNHKFHAGGMINFC